MSSLNLHLLLRYLTHCVKANKLGFIVPNRNSWIELILGRKLDD